MTSRLRAAGACLALLLAALLPAACTGHAPRKAADKAPDKAPAIPAQPARAPAVSAGVTPAATPGVTAAAPPGPAAIPPPAPAPLSYALPSYSLAVHFAPGRSTLDAHARALLDGLAAKVGDAVHVRGRASGHADLSEGGARAVTLSRRRAQAVLAYLQARGGLAHTLSLQTQAHGSKQPVGDFRKAAGRALNRRVEIELTALPEKPCQFATRMADKDDPGAQVRHRYEFYFASNDVRGASADFACGLHGISYFRLIGHADNVGGDAANEAIALRRAQGFRDALVRAGIDPSRIQVRSAGAREPQADNATPEGRAQNRRVEIEVVGTTK